MRREVGKVFSEMTLMSDGGFVFTATKDTTSNVECE